MFDTMKFGKALSTLRKEADMTQNEMADKLNLSRQAISKYERGESFPDISVLVMIAELFHITLDQLINYGEPTKGESSILRNVAKGNADISAENIADVVNLAPLLKPSILTKLSRQFDASVKLEGEKQYIGYDNIGEDFEPEVTYWDVNNTNRYGVYAACGDLIAKKFGTKITVLDLGAGLGTASIPLAKNGIYTIAADISAVMLGTAAKRAKGLYDNLILAQMNAYDMMLPDNSIGIVVENAMLHLVGEPELVIKEIVRVLKPDEKLIRYGSPGLLLTKEEVKQSRLCNAVLSDVSDYYYHYLENHDYQSTVFNVDHSTVLLQYFESPYNEIAEGFTEVFTDKMKFRLHRMKTGAHSDLQRTPQKLIDAAWKATDEYARKTYGNDYAKIKSFSRYGAAMDIYTVKK